MGFSAWVRSRIRSQHRGSRTDLLQSERGEQPSWRDLSQARVIINEAPDLIEQDQ
jgi:hypothetical protein